MIITTTVLISMMRGFNSSQKFLMFAVGFVEVLRMLGIFLVLPVFTQYGQLFTHSALLIGVALGGYGLTMAIFQAPFGIISDRFGRKRVILLGMIPYIIGNFIAWHPGTITILIIGRVIAGAGAITSTGMAFVQESVPEERRNIAMAILGIPIGLSFMVGIILGPYLGGLFGYSSLFLISAILGIVAIFPLLRIKEERKARERHERKRVGRVQWNALMVGAVGFIVSFYMIAFFFYLPTYAKSAFPNIDFYLLLIPPVIIGGIIAMGASMYADRGRNTLFSIIALVVLLASVPFVFVIPHISGSGILFMVGAVIFFSGYSIYEIVFTPLVAKLSARESYGANIGAYNMMQFTGQFVGGAAGGALITLNLTYGTMIRTTIVLAVLLAVSLVFLYLPTRFKEVKKRPSPEST